MAIHSAVIKLILAWKDLYLISISYTKIEIIFLPLYYLHRCTRRYFFNSAIEQMTKTRGYCFLAALGAEGPSSSMGHVFSRLLCVVYNLSMLLLCHQTLPLGMFLMFMCPHFFSLKDTSQIC